MHEFIRKIRAHADIKAYSTKPSGSKTRDSLAKTIVFAIEKEAIERSAAFDKAML